MGVASAVLLFLAVQVEKEKGAYEVPKTFERGAEKFVKNKPDLLLDDRLRKRFAQFTEGNNLAALAQEPAVWLPYIIEGLLSDDEVTARVSLKALHDYCDRERITTELGQNPVHLEFANSAYYRAGEHRYWAEWWCQKKDRITREALARNRFLRGTKAAQSNWDDLMKHLRPGTGFDDPRRPEGHAFARIKEMGTSAYPFMALYIDHEDPMLGRAAVAAINALSGQQFPLPTEEKRSRIRADCEAWIRGNGYDGLPTLSDLIRTLTAETTEGDVNTMVGKLSSDDIATREKAAADLEARALPHAILVRKALEDTQDPESRSRLKDVLVMLDILKEEEQRLRANPDLLLDFLRTLPKDRPDYEAIWSRTGRLYRELTGK